MQEVQTTLTEGTVIQNRYMVEALLGKGGFGAVYLVRDMRVRSNLFALKEVIDPSKRDRKRFIFEGELLKQLDYPALPRVYRVFENDAEKRVYLLMDYIEGPNLEHLRLQQPNKRFSLAETLHIMAPIMDAVGYLHRQQPPIIHRDIKPANIIVPNKGDEPELVDFGIAKPYDPDATTTAVRRASPGYGAPEQYSKGTNTCTDIYGLGATLYALLSGEVPVDAFTRMTALGSGKNDPLVPVNTLVPGIPQYVADAIQKAMAIDSQTRFATVEEFWQALNARPLRQTPTTVVPMAVPIRGDAATTYPDNEEKDAVPAIADGTTQQRQGLAATGAAAVPPFPPSRRPVWKWLPFLLLLLALLMGLGVGAGLWSYMARHTVSTTPSAAHHASSVTATSVVSTPTHATRPTATPTAHPSPTPTSPPVVVPTQSPSPRPQPTPTKRPVVYPAVAGSYNGTAHNTTAGINAAMSLSIRQSGSAISGSFTVASPLQGSNNFTGSITTGRTIQFTVASYNGAAPLFFTGYTQSNNSMSGQYCSLDASGHCSASAGGAGTWDVVATSLSGS